jgi:molybdopterin-containing oxidoreductase family membrane subunit
MSAIWNRMTGPYATSYWSLVACNIVGPNVLWFKKVRNTPWLLFISSLIVLVGMWLERFVIIVSSLAQDYVPSSWSNFHATRWDWATYLGTIGLFLFLFFLFIRLLPMISIFEVRTLLPEAKVEEETPVE